MNWTTAFRMAYVFIIAALLSLLARSATAPVMAVGARGDVPARDTQLVAIYFGSPECAFSQDPSLPRMLRETFAALKDQADGNGWRFISVGVAITGDVRGGLRHLNSVAAFDEVSAGGNWFNEVAIEYIYRRLPGVPGTPQLVVVRRVAIAPRATQPAGFVGDDMLLARRLGLRELAAFHGVGARLPTQGNH